MIMLSARCRHLIHNSARRTHDEFLDHLAEQPDFARTDNYVVARGYRVHHRYFERSRRTDALAFRYLRVNQNATAVLKADPSFARKHQEDACDVSCPVV